MKTSSRLIALAAAAILALFSGSAGAQTIFWTGSAGGNWDSTSWSSTADNPGVTTTPVNGNSLHFRQTLPGGDPTNRTMNNDLVGLSVATIDISNGNPTGYSLSGNKLTVTTGITGGGTGNNTISLPVELNTGFALITGNTLGSGLLTISGDISEIGGSRNVVIQSGALALSGSNTFTGDFRIGNAAAATVSVNALDNTTVDQPLGKGQRIAIGYGNNNGTLIYTGSANAATDRQLQIGRIDASATKTLTLGGSNTGNNTWATEIKNNRADATALIGLIKEDAGTWILNAANTYTGATTVSEGTLLINGSTAAGSAVTVAAGAVFGGNGTVNGNLTLDNGALFAFDTAYTLDLGVGSTFALNSSFGVASLRNLNGGAIDWGSIGDGTYTLIQGGNLGAGFFSASNITDFGEANAYDIGGGRSAYFDNGSLQLVVIPEPSTWALLSGSLAAFAIFRRRFKRS